MILLIDTTIPYHRTIKIKPIDVKTDSFAEDHEESN